MVRHRVVVSDGDCARRSAKRIASFHRFGLVTQVGFAGQSPLPKNASCAYSNGYSSRSRLQPCYATSGGGAMASPPRGQQNGWLRAIAFPGPRHSAPRSRRRYRRTHSAELARDQRPELLCNRPLARMRAEQTNLHHGIPTFVACAHERAACQIIADQAQWQPRDTTTVLRHCFQGCAKMRGKYRLKPSIAALVSANFSQDSSEPGFRTVNQVAERGARRSRQSIAGLANLIRSDHWHQPVITDLDRVELVESQPAWCGWMMMVEKKLGLAAGHERFAGLQVVGE